MRGPTLESDTTGSASRYRAAVPLDRRRVLVVEDEVLMASLIVEVLREAGFEASTAPDVATARDLIDDFDPDMVLLDISLGAGPTGVHLAHSLDATRPDIAILFLTRHADAASARAEGLELPPNVGFLRKHMVHDENYLLDAIEKVFAERSAEVRQDEPIVDPFPGLTDQEVRLLRMIAEGLGNRQIAERCSTSTKSVERWIDRLYRTLGIETKGDTIPRVEAARRYFLAAGVPEASDL